MKEEECSQLLILGNGFDLACNLKSSFNDFYNEYFIDSETVDVFNISYFGNFIPSRYIKYGIVDLAILTSTIQKNKNILWRDVESIISDLADTGRSTINLRRIQSVILNSMDNNSLDILEKNQSNQIRKVSYTLRSQIMNQGGGHILSNKKNLNLLLMAMLKNSIYNFEQSFKDYMCKNLDKCSAWYKDNAEKVYSHLASGKEKETYVINFNYTSINKNDFYEYINVHGNLDSEEVIFGIDESVINKENDKFYDLTKTYRKMILDARLKVRNKSLPKYIKAIKFFGHSLGKADYAYFRSIFDFYNIYDSDIVLIFYYYNYAKSEDLLAQQTKNVIKLLKNYGESFSGDLEKKGDNLVHKLSLEGRLQVQEIKINYNGMLGSQPGRIILNVQE